MADARKGLVISGGSRGIGAASILWLASDAASYVTGALLDVSGGR